MMQNKITILGSSTCISSFYKPFDFRYPPGLLIQYKNQNMLLDCSEGIRARLEILKFDYYKINSIFISHFHPDHFALDSFLQSIYVRAKKQSEKKEIKIFGPKNIEKIFSLIWDMKHTEDHYQRNFKPQLNIKFTEINNKKTITLSKKNKIKAFKVFHENMDAYAFRFELNNKIISYSGDSGYSESLCEAALNSDYFICESTNNVEDNNIKNGHLNSYQAGTLARKTNAKHLILVHYSGIDNDDKMIESVKKSGFIGKVTIGKDFQTFSI